MKYFLRTVFIGLSLTVPLNVQAQNLDTILVAHPYQLHFRILKGQKPPILFEAGGGQAASQWDSIATAVHQRLGATVITYDRAGFGQSSFDSAGYTILQEIKNLESVLLQLGYRNTKLLLVGHSLGAFYNWIYAARHPAQVKGIVFVDPRLPSYADMRLSRTYFQGLNRKDYETEYMSLYYLLARIERTSDYVRQVTLPASIPLLNLMAENGPFSDAKENRRFKADQRSLVKGHANRRLVHVVGTSHNIPHDQPGLLIEQLASFYQQHL